MGVWEARTLSYSTRTDLWLEIIDRIIPLNDTEMLLRIPASAKCHSGDCCASTSLPRPEIAISRLGREALRFLSHRYLAHHSQATRQPPEKAQNFRQPW